MGLLDWIREKRNINANTDIDPEARQEAEKRAKDIHRRLMNAERRTYTEGVKRERRSAH